MAVRLTSNTIRTLYAIQCIKTDIKRRSQSPVHKNRTQELCKTETAGQVSAKSATDSMNCNPPCPKSKPNQKQRCNASNETALVHKVHPGDRPLRNNVQERAKCKELEDILAKWNVYKPNR